jgi:hypothetical protein
MAAHTLDSTQKKPGNLKRTISSEEFGESTGSLKRTNSNEESEADVSDVNGEMLPSPLRHRRAASSGTSRPIATFSGAKPGMVPTRALSHAQQRLPSASAQNENDEQQHTPDKPVRKPTRVVSGARLPTKKDGGYSPVPATISAGSPTRSSSTANDLHLEDAEEDNGTFARIGDRKHVKIADGDKENGTALQRDDSFQGTSSSGNNSNTSSSGNNSNSESASTSTSATPAGNEGGEGGGPARRAKKSLGWGDKKAPPLNYKPWYSVFIW